MREITIHEALGKLKLLNNKIESKIDSAMLISSKKNAADKVLGTNLTTEEFAKATKAEYSSINDLIKLADEIKSKIVISNATTKIKIGEKEMTVAQAIEKKKSIEFKEELLRRMKNSYSYNIRKVEDANSLVESNLDNKISDLISNAKENSKSLEEVMNMYRENNGYSLIDPLKLEDKIKELSDEIDEFKSNVDICLSVSNATTVIEIEE